MQVKGRGRKGVAASPMFSEWRSLKFDAKLEWKNIVIRQRIAYISGEHLYKFLCMRLLYLIKLSSVLKSSNILHF
jgi:hypothetical protein